MSFPTDFQRKDCICIAGSVNDYKMIYVQCAGIIYWIMTLQYNPQGI